MPVTVVTDSTCDLSREMTTKYGIVQVPLYAIWGSERFRDGIDITMAEFHRRLMSSKENPVSEEPSSDEFAAAFQKAIGAGRDVICPTIGSKLSKTFASASEAARNFPGKVEVVDTETFSGGLALHAMLAAELAKAGVPLQEIAARLRSKLATQRGNMVLPDVTFLGRSGRLNKAVVSLAQMMRLSPILQLNHGVAESATQTNDFEKSRRQLISIALRSLADTSKIRFMVGTVDSPDLATEFEKEIREKLIGGCESLFVYGCGPVVATNSGPRACAVFSMPID